MIQLDMLLPSDYEAEELAIHADNARFRQVCNALKLAAITIRQNVSLVVNTQLNLFSKLPVPELTIKGWAW